MNTADEGIGPLNLGNPVEFSMLELAEKVIRRTGSKSTIHFESLPQDDPQQEMPDVRLAKKLRNWEAKVS
jgi:UDP-glucuronate decarboxylase